jgi:hypothetical protein
MYINISIESIVSCFDGLKNKATAVGDTCGMILHLTRNLPFVDIWLFNIAMERWIKVGLFIILGLKYS